jgi:hypothetical protein
MTIREFSMGSGRVCLSAALLLGLLTGCSGEPLLEQDEDPRSVYPNLVEGERGEVIVNIPGSGPERLTYVVRNGIPYHSGDIQVSPEQLAGVADPRTTAGGIIGEYARWPNGEIPVVFSSSVRNDPGTLPTIAQALGAWIAETADGAGTARLTFPAYNSSIHTSYLYFTIDNGIPGGGSADSLGRSPTSARNTIRLRSGAALDTITHEIGHILGLHHEQQRSDRDNYIRVNTPAIHPDWRSQFEKKNGSIGLAPGFDFSSIMLYESYGSMCTDWCMVRLNGTTWGRNTTISDQDAEGVLRLHFKPSAVVNTFTDAATPLKSIQLVSPAKTTTHTLGLKPSDKHIMHYSPDGNVEDFGTVAPGGTNGRFAAVATNGRYDWVTVSSTKVMTHGWRTAGVTSYETKSLGNSWESALGVAIARQSATQLTWFAVLKQPGQSPRIYYQNYVQGSGWNDTCTAPQGEPGCVAGWHPVPLTNGTPNGQIAAVSWGPGRLDVVAATTLGLEHNYWANAGIGWQGPHLVDTAPVAGPVAIASPIANRLDIFYHRSFGSTGTLQRVSFEDTWGGSVREASNSDVSEISAVGRRSTNEIFVDYTRHEVLPEVPENNGWLLVTLTR